MTARSIIEQRIRENIGNSGLTRAARDVAAVFDSANFPYLLCGGYAVQTYGYFRSTQDVDALVKDMELGRRLLLTSNKFKPVRGTERRVIHSATGVQVDLLPGGEKDSPGALPFPDPTTEKGTKKLGLRFVTLPTLVALKLMAFRAQDQADVVALMTQNKIQAEVLTEIPPLLQEKFIALWKLAKQESSTDQNRY